MCLFPQVVFDLGRKPEARFLNSQGEYLRDEEVGELLPVCLTVPCPTIVGMTSILTSIL